VILQSAYEYPTKCHPPPGQHGPAIDLYVLQNLHTRISGGVSYSSLYYGKEYSYLTKFLSLRNVSARAVLPSLGGFSGVVLYFFMNFLSSLGTFYSSPGMFCLLCGLYVFCKGVSSSTGPLCLLFGRFVFFWPFCHLQACLLGKFHLL
jgi:hypothetical protein